MIIHKSPRWLETSKRAKGSELLIPPSKSSYQLASAHDPADSMILRGKDLWYMWYAIFHQDKPQRRESFVDLYLYIYIYKWCVLKWQMSAFFSIMVTIWQKGSETFWKKICGKMWKFWVEMSSGILEVHPRKLTCPLKKDYFSREYMFQP